MTLGSRILQFWRSADADDESNLFPPVKLEIFSENEVVWDPKRQQQHLIGRRECIFDLLRPLAKYSMETDGPKGGHDPNPRTARRDGSHNLRAADTKEESRAASRTRKVDIGASRS